MMSLIGSSKASSFNKEGNLMIKTNNKIRIELKYNKEDNQSYNQRRMSRNYSATINKVMSKNRISHSIKVT